jgi:hypothetical protein
VALSQDVATGYDAYEHMGTQQWDFSPVPIPADFFGPGSDPFTGIVDLQGLPLGSTTECPSGLGNADTIVRRLQNATLPSIGSSDTVPIELVELSLVSTQPITVTYNGGQSPETWDVTLTLSQSATSTGTMTIDKTVADGGIFGMTIDLEPRFVFTRVSDSATMILDFPGTWTDTLSTANVPWVYNAIGFACPPCGSNFVPGNDGTQEVQFAANGLQSGHLLSSACAPTVIPLLTSRGMLVMIGFLLLAGAFMLAKRRRRLAS